AGQASAGGGLQLLERGGHDDRGRQPVVLAQVPRGQQDAVRGEQRIVVALSGAAGIFVDGVLGGRAVHARVLVEGVAHTRGGQLGEHGLQGGAGLGGQA